MHCAPFLLTMQIIFASVSYRRVVADLRVDITLVSLAILISLAFTMRIEGVREGSVIAACITGYIVNFLNYKVMTRKTLYRIIPIKHE